MNTFNIQALRQLNAKRDFHAGMLLCGATGSRAVNANDQISAIDVQMAQRMQTEYRDSETILASILRNGIDQLTNAQRTIIKNTMSTTTGSQGGYSVPTTVGVAIADAMKMYSSMRRAGSVVVTETGANMTWPNSDGRSETGELVGQNIVATASDPIFGSTVLNTFRFGSKVITAPMELIQDGAIDIVGFISGRIAARIGRISNTKFTVGAGTTEPLGVVGSVSVGKIGTTGQTTSLIRDDIADLVTSVDPTYRESGKCVWMMNDATLTFIRKMKDSTGQPLNLVVPGIKALGEPDTIEGFSVVVNNDMPSMAANAKSILFGDFSTYIIRDTPEIGVIVMTDSAYTLKGQIGYLGMARCGGAYVDVGNAIMAYQNSAS